MSFDNLNKDLSKPLGLRLFQGIVIDNNDPLGLDRVKCSVPELYNPDIGPIPWIVPVKASMFGQGGGCGSFGVPPVGSTLIIALQENDANYPVYLGYFVSMQNKNPNPPGVHALVDQSGSTLKVDTNSNELTYSHVSGVTINMKDGNLSITASSNQTVKISGNVDYDVGGAFNIKASSFKVDAPATFTSGINNTSGSISSGNLVFETHRHTGVDTGHGTSGGPV